MDGTAFPRPKNISTVVLAVLSEVWLWIKRPAVVCNPH